VLRDLPAMSAPNLPMVMFGRIRLGLDPGTPIV
jgi:hypothetical protein